MPKRRKLNAADRRQLQAADLQLFVKATERKARGAGLDPNDRRIDRRTADAVRHLQPERFDQLLRGEED